MFLLNILLALVWVLLTGRFIPGNFLFGFLLAYLILWLMRRSGQESVYFQRVPRCLSFALFFISELVKANLKVAYDVLTPTHHMRPGIIAIPLDTGSDAEITLLANLITLTPGTLSLDVSSDRRTLYIHAMYMEDIDKVREEIKEGFERRVRELLQ
jgi:multicomponent Na+:H+ antiporter subunit E